MESKPKSPQSAPKLQTREEQLAQAAAMLAKRIFEHKTVREIADEFGVDRVTASRRLALARKEGVPEEARIVFIREMLPLAMAVVQNALLSEDEKIRVKVAMDIIAGLEAMKSPEAREAAGAKVTIVADKEDTLEVWRERVKLTRAKTHSGGEAPGGAGEVIDATALPSGDTKADAPED